MADLESLSCLLERDGVQMVPYGDEHKEVLRAICAEDTEIWEIYPVSMLGDRFDATIEVRSLSTEWVNFAALQNGELVGITGYIRPDPVNGVVEIGGTYIAPRLRGTGYNRAMKRLLIEHAFACGFRKIEFRVDERNKRSQAAVLKLGALREGLLRFNMITWTGFVRSTCIFGLMADEWKPE